MRDPDGRRAAAGYLKRNRTDRPTLTAVPADNPKLWTCTGCGAVGAWADGWKWWGNYTRAGRENVDAVHCPACPAPTEGPDRKAAA